MQRFLEFLLPLADILLAPFVYPAGFFLKAIRKAGVWRMPFCKRAFMRVGVFPIRNHYYEPLFDSSKLKHSLSDDRDLPGIDWNVNEQLDLLNKFCFSEELKNIPMKKVDDLTFYFNNRNYESGEAEYLYNMIRLKKPAMIIEIGSGYSTLMAVKAIKMNQVETSDYHCNHICIEPFEMTWLEKTGATVLRQRVEEVDKSLFGKLGENDLLFIDSSHIIRPQGDVLLEFLEVLPSLRDGVIVHIHDIFSPKDYLKKWITDEVMFWNEQYLLEAFLTCNREWKVIGALNYLHHNHFDQLKEKCIFLTDDREPASFYIQKIA